MSHPSLNASELIAWNNSITRKWRDFLATEPKVLDLPCDIFAAGTVRGLLRHIVATEVRYADLLAAYPPGDYANLPAASVEELFEPHDRALRIFDALLKTTGYDWDIKIEFQTLTLGPRRAPRRAILFHAMLHGIRHYAQLSTVVRNAGYTPSLVQDYLPMDSEPA
ncbi:MAG: DinB family protein [Acidobacteriaceae bacterium]